MRVKSNLKQILESRKMSIRSLSEQTGIPFETVRRLYNDTTVRYERNTLGKICETLNIDISDLLVLIKEEDTE
ncbi:helix-turn-helix transcriptional regulator [Bacillus sp. FSL W8-0223]|uniref:helix-turn-helix domain-containing protein n=1 Tax=Bacillus sp. FSL W8-0223 TaxID=2954595 RepID=UPI0030FA68A9